MTSIGNIYKIICNLDNSICYIGSTFNTLYKRFEEHKNQYKNNNGEYSIHKYFNKYGIDNFKIELIKSYNVIRTHQKDYKHLYVYETLWINKTKNCVNKIVSFNPLKKERHKQYNDNHKEEIAEQKKQYYESNKKEILEKQKQKFNCECGSKYTIQHRARHFKTTKHIKFLKNK